MFGRIVGWAAMTSDPPRPAMLLGAAGLAPFFGLAIAAQTLDGGWAATATSGLLLYGAAILSFMGGCRWGFAAAGLGEGPDWRPLAMSVAPSLWAWALVWAYPTLLGAAATGALLALGFGILLWDDARATRSGAAPAWWRSLRAPLTLGACLALASLSLA